MPQQLDIYRNHAPHWRLEGSVYLVTWRLAAGSADLAEEERDVVVASLKFYQPEKYTLFAWVVMNDHVQVLVRPEPGVELSKIVYGWKSFTANRLQRLFSRVGSVWQKDSIDRIIRDQEEFEQKGQYILDNPRRRWPELNNYKWVGWG